MKTSVAGFCCAPVLLGGAEGPLCLAERKNQEDASFKKEKQHMVSRKIILLVDEKTYRFFSFPKKL